MRSWLFISNKGWRVKIITAETELSSGRSRKEGSSYRRRRHERRRSVGPPGPKLVRLIYFVGAAVICTAAINKWREYERKTIMQQQRAKGVTETESSSDAVAVQKALK